MKIHHIQKPPYPHYNDQEFLIIITYGASSKRELSDAHLERVGIWEQLVDQKDSEHRRDEGQTSLNIHSRSMANTFQVTDRSHHRSVRCRWPRRNWVQPWIAHTRLDGSWAGVEDMCAPVTDFDQTNRHRLVSTNGRRRENNHLWDCRECRSSPIHSDTASTVDAWEFLVNCHPQCRIWEGKYLL